MGDKGGKKDKNKAQKQMAQLRDQKAKEKQVKQQKPTPYPVARGTREPTAAPDVVRTLI